jgi:di/tricarboxylate transporter
VIEAEPESLSKALTSLGLVLEESVKPEPASQDAEDDAVAARPQSDAGEKTESRRDRRQDDIVLRELVVLPTSALVDRSASDVQIRSVYGLNLIAISRQGRRSIRRLRSTRIKAGDVLLLQGPPDAIDGFAADLGCVPLAERVIRIPSRRKLVAATATMGCAIAGAAFGLVPAAVAFAAGVVALMVLRVLPLRRMYEAIDWPVVVLLGALIPVAAAMDTTGAADLLARSLLDVVAQGQPVVALALILIVSMTLSDFMNNAATAAVLCPIAISAAEQLGVGADSFLMAVAIGASCAFLTPIGHQNNTLILGPGGLRFGDYWRLGLPMELLVLVVGIPMLLIVWPF